MKKIITLLPFSLICLFLRAEETTTLKLLWETEAVFDTPESVCLNEERNEVYVSNVGGKSPWTKDGYGFISKITFDGKLIERVWIDGIDGPKGMGVYGNKLFAANLNELIIIDIDECQIVDRITIEGAQSLNDITVDAEGNVYISDSSQKTIFKYTNGKISVFAKDYVEAKRINGLLIHEGKLLSATNNRIVQFDLETAACEVLLENTGGVDGLGVIADDSYIYSHWNGRVFTHEAGKEKQVILDLREQEKNTADVFYDPKTKYLWVPTFFDNRIAVYEVKN